MEPPKVTRTIPGLDQLLATLRSRPGRWGKVTLEGVKASTLSQALTLAGCEVVRRKGGTEVHACWPGEPDVETDVADVDPLGDVE